MEQTGRDSCQRQSKRGSCESLRPSVGVGTWVHSNALQFGNSLREPQCLQVGHLNFYQRFFNVIFLFSAAVEHFLAALNLQRSARGPAGARTVMSDNIWSTLRMAISLMGRTDLHLVCDERNLDKLNHEFPVS